MIRFEINQNGDQPGTLKEQGLAVRRAAEILEKALKAALPHQRNYQTVAHTDAYQKDRAVQLELITTVHNIGLTGYDMAIRALQQQEDRDYHRRRLGS